MSQWERIRPGTTLYSMTAEPKGGEVLVLSKWGDKIFVCDADGNITSLTCDDVNGKNWEVIPENLIARD